MGGRARPSPWVDRAPRTRPPLARVVSFVSLLNKAGMLALLLLHFSRSAILAFMGHAHGLFVHVRTWRLGLAPVTG